MDTRTGEIVYLSDNEIPPDGVIVGPDMDYNQFGKLVPIGSHAAAAYTKKQTSRENRRRIAKMSRRANRDRRK